MSRYLVVAHETVTNPELLRQVKAVMKEDQQAEFVLLVPATPVRHLRFRRSSGDRADEVAHKLADKARALFDRKGVKVADAVVGASSPVEAIDEEMRARPGYAGVVISTLPKETSRWLQMDLPRTVESKYGLPVYHVQAADDWSAGDLP